MEKLFENKFFVYGSLKVGGYFSLEFDELRKSCTEAKLPNHVMYDLGSFPAIVPGDGEVFGELHEYEDINYVLNRMDTIEGFDGSKYSLYYRKEVEVVKHNGEPEKAFVYIFNTNRQKIPKEHCIKSGVWKI